MPALFTVDADLIYPTELTRGGWAADAQHGSPPSGILARAVEVVPTAAPMQVVRFTIDLFRPVPLTPLRIETMVRRDGRRIQVVDAVLRAGHVEVGRASALKIRLTELDLPDPPEDDWRQPPGPDAAELIDLADTFRHGDELARFHTHGVEIRSHDRSFTRLGPGVSWFRLRVPLVEGEEPTPFQVLATLADMSNGNSQSLHPWEWLYVNPDITLYAHRLPVDEWVGMVSVAHQHPTGIGLADTRVFDRRGPLGRVSQAQLIERH